jgi:DNA-binding XRE family transcriptional regulator
MTVGVRFPHALYIDPCGTLMRYTIKEEHAVKYNFKVEDITVSELFMLSLILKELDVGRQLDDVMKEFPKGVPTEAPIAPPIVEQSKPTVQETPKPPVFTSKWLEGTAATKAPSNKARPVAKQRVKGIGAIRTKSKFYSRLRFERAKHGWSVNDMGNILGCSKSTYSLLENSITSANIVQYTKLSDALGIPVSELFNEHGFALSFAPTRVIEQ